MRPRVFIGLAGKRAGPVISTKCLDTIKQSREGGQGNGRQGSHAALFLLSPVDRYNASVG